MRARTYICTYIHGIHNVDVLRTYVCVNTTLHACVHVYIYMHLMYKTWDERNVATGATVTMC